MDSAWMAVIPDDLNIDVREAKDKRGRELPLYRNNQMQETAIREALQRKFTVIQGPPGEWFTVIQLPPGECLTAFLGLPIVRCRIVYGLRLRTW